MSTEKIAKALSDAPPTAEELAELKARLALYEALIQEIALQTIDARIELLGNQLLRNTTMH
jgi:hypothetical protein